MGTRVQLLGEFGLENAGSEVVLPPCTQRLMAFLALQGPAHRGYVSGMLWPDVPESRALASLRTVVWRVNRVRSGLVTTDGAGLSLASEVSVDSREQEAFTTRLLREHVEDAKWIDDHLHLLWCCDLLPGWYDDWVVHERERLSQLRLHALEYLAAFMTHRDDLALALQLAFEAVRVEPLRETANARLIEVYLAEGNVADAVHRFETFRSLLQRELGLEPSPSMSDLLPRSRVGRPCIGPRVETTGSMTRR